MEISNVYVYFNNKGELISKAPYIDSGNVRQGSDFNLNLLFNKDLDFTNCLMQLRFKCPGQTQYNIFPFLSYNDVEEQEIATLDNPFIHKGLIKFEQNLTRYGIAKDVEYNQWQFSSNAAALTDVLTEVDGNLEAEITIFNEKREQTVFGVIKIFIEKTLDYESPYQVYKPDLDRFLTKVQEISGQIAADLMPEQYITDIKTDKDEYTLTVEKYIKDTQSTSSMDVVLPLPNVKKDVNIKMLDGSDTAKASVIGSGKTDDPLRFNLEIPKGKDGTGVYQFEIGADGNLYLYAQNFSDYEDGDYYIDEETGELILNF